MEMEMEMDMQIKILYSKQRKNEKTENGSNSWFAYLIINAVWGAVEPAATVRQFKQGAQRFSNWACIQLQWGQLADLSDPN